MTDSTTPQGDNDQSTDPAYTQLGDEGNPFSGPKNGGGAAGDAGIDQVPSGGDDPSDGEQNAPLPDWGPTDGTHGVDGADPEK